MNERMIIVDFWFPDDSSYAQDIFEIPYQTLMLWLATSEIYLCQYRDDEQRNEPVPHYKITNSIFEMDGDEEKVIIYTDYADHNYEAKRKRESSQI